MRSWALTAWAGQVAGELGPGEYGANAGARLAGMERAMAAEPAGAAGLLALDWANGNRYHPPSPPWYAEREPGGRGRSA